MDCLLYTSNAPAFVLRENLTVETKDYGKLTMDVAWGGNLYAIMPAESIGITIDPVSYTHLDVYKRQMVFAILAMETVV